MYWLLLMTGSTEGQRAEAMGRTLMRLVGQVGKHQRMSSQSSNCLHLETSNCCLKVLRRQGLLLAQRGPHSGSLLTDDLDPGSPGCP